MNIHFLNSFKFPDSEQSFCNHDEGSHYSTDCNATFHLLVFVIAPLGGETIVDSFASMCEEDLWMVQLYGYFPPSFTKKIPS